MTGIGAWATLTNNAPAAVEHMLLLTDGAVMAQQYHSSNWYKLTPAPDGTYVNGTWQSLAAGVYTSSRGTVPYGPQFYASAVLADGRVIIAGGENNFSNQLTASGGSIQIDDTGAALAPGEDGSSGHCVIYDPQSNTWDSLTFPGGSDWQENNSGRDTIDDAPCCVLPDGRFMIGSTNSGATAIFDPTLNSWSAGPRKVLSSWEAGWTLMPDGSIVTIDVADQSRAVGTAFTERLAPNGTPRWYATNVDSAASSDLVYAPPNWNQEIGPALLLADGRIFAMGASAATAFYTASSDPNGIGAWAAGPSFPNNLLCIDGPAVLLPSGRVFCVRGAADGTQSGHPLTFFEFDPTASTNAFLPTVSYPSNPAVDTASVQMLLLPTGEVLVSIGPANAVHIYQPAALPASANAAPVITSSPGLVTPGGVYTVSGRLFNGVSQANAYGDDAAMATNYPLVQVRNIATGHVAFWRTHSHSSMGVNTGGATVSTQFDAPLNTPDGAYDLWVIANGVRSNPVPIQVGPATPPAFVANAGSCAALATSIEKALNTGFRLTVTAKALAASQLNQCRIGGFYTEQEYKTLLQDLNEE